MALKRFPNGSSITQLLHLSWSGVYEKLTWDCDITLYSIDQNQAEVLIVMECHNDVITYLSMLNWRCNVNMAIIAGLLIENYGLFVHYCMTNCCSFMLLLNHILLHEILVHEISVTLVKTNISYEISVTFITNISCCSHQYFTNISLIFRESH